MKGVGTCLGGCCAAAIGQGEQTVGDDGGGALADVQGVGGHWEHLWVARREGSVRAAGRMSAKRTGITRLQTQPPSPSRSIRVAVGRRARQRKQTDLRPLHHAFQVVHAVVIAATQKSHSLEKVFGAQFCHLLSSAARVDIALPLVTVLNMAGSVPMPPADVPDIMLPLIRPGLCDADASLRTRCSLSTVMPPRTTSSPSPPPAPRLLQPPPPPPAGPPVALLVRRLQLTIVAVLIPASCTC